MLAFILCFWPIMIKFPVGCKTSLCSHTLVEVRIPNVVENTIEVSGTWCKPELPRQQLTQLTQRLRLLR